MQCQFVRVYSVRVRSVQVCYVIVCGYTYRSFLNYQRSITRRLVIHQSLIGYIDDLDTDSEMHMNHQLKSILKLYY